MEIGMYKFIAGQRKTLIAAQLKVGTFINSYKYFEKNPKPNFLNFRDKLNAEYWLEEKEIELINKFGEKYLEENFIENLISDIKKHNKEAENLNLLLNDIDFSRLNNEETINLLDIVYKNLFEMMGTLFLSQDVFTGSVEGRLKELLDRELEDETERNDIFNLLITSFETDGINRELVNWYNFILKNERLNREELRNYIFRNGWLIYNAFDDDSADDFIFNRYEEDLKKKDKLGDEIVSLLEKNKRKKDEFDKKTEKLSGETKYLARVLRDLSELRLDVKIANNSLEVSLNMKFLLHVAKKNKISFMDLLDGYFKEDIERLLLEGVNVSEEEVENRKSFVSFIGKNGKVEIITGPSAKNKVYEILDKQSSGAGCKILKGQTASVGNVKGRAKIIRLGDSFQLEEDFRKFKKGDIIVTIMTQPNIMPIAKKASGIVTDEGGICSHAAIISRELKIPCIVGTGMATKEIKDGDIIMIDSKKGTVEILDN